MTEHYFGGGSNGIAWLESMTHGLASEGDVSVFFKVRDLQTSVAGVSRKPNCD